MMVCFTAEAMRIQKETNKQDVKKETTGFSKVPVWMCVVRNKRCKS